MTSVYWIGNVVVRKYGQESSALRLVGGFVMSTEVVILILILVAMVVLDLAAPRWGADSRRLDPQAFTSN